jgi:nitrilase
MILLPHGTLALMRACEVALVQVCAGPDPEPNVRRASECCAQALHEGAELVVLPEGYAEIPTSDRAPTWRFDPDAPETGLAIAPFVALSLAHPHAILVLGGVPEAIPGDLSSRHHNTCVVLHAGRVAARYRKIHLFELSLPDQPAMSESRRVVPGREPIVVATPLGRIGLSICYDLRFPELYRSLTSAGAELLVVPAAFTHTTGLAHWEVLLRARAIESQCWLLAAAQWGVHGEGPRRSFGHSMIVDPWGRVVARLDEGEGLVRARIDAEPLERARGVLPALEHRVLDRETPATIVTLSEVPEA